ncbi:MAG: hypothetical protein C4532_17220 [Candidatus Abyssobacteria bacterium SURF_17]|uniref:Uncharacterized protein n=1 Tax=Candidatus Abyssobacteria bacterium SURF_17 TaxID=2093361 RepID=A0A419EQU7_9BACT|nr:MAG: hypothetical protein C4532_17220 [Candidatus Abyssubacteria bacterium SURF_17]
MSRAFATEKFKGQEVKSGRVLGNYPAGQYGTQAQRITSLQSEQETYFVGATRRVARERGVIECLAQDVNETC